MTLCPKSKLRKKSEIDVLTCGFLEMFKDQFARYKESIPLINSLQNMKNLIFDQF